MAGGAVGAGGGGGAGGTGGSAVPTGIGGNGGNYGGGGGAAGYNNQLDTNTGPGPKGGDGAKGIIILSYNPTGGGGVVAPVMFKNLIGVGV